MSSNILKQLELSNEKVGETWKIFKKVYGSLIKRTTLSNIINGENIEIKKENITIDNCDYQDTKFDSREKFCTKKLYDYQKKSILKIFELETNGYTIDPITGKKIISNGYILNLPIGSGKSLVFTWIALFKRIVPKHPIIISTDGSNIPKNECMQWKYYPFYYETCCYTENNNENAVVVMEEYEQREMTVILTHEHLLNQLRSYIYNDFPILANKTNICIANDMFSADMNASILIITATEKNVNELVKLSYIKPFMRVIIDDYTSMTDLESFREILASFTLFVSGSGFERDFDSIPPSYYSLKYAPSNKLSIVGKPEETYKGILRNNILTMEILGSSCEFSTYEFIESVEQNAGQYRCELSKLYPLLEKESSIRHFMSLEFLLNNSRRIKNAIHNIINDYDLNNEQSKKNKNYKSKYDQKEISYFLEWKKMMEKSPSNPLLCELLSSKGISIEGEPVSIVNQQCMICKKTVEQHNNFGALACCCGAFYCENCLKSMCTHKIINSETGEMLIDKDNKYCSCCRHVNPKYYINITKKKDKNVFGYNLIKAYFDTKDLENHINFDYYYYMLLKGLEPKYANGPGININNEISQGSIEADCFKNNIIPEKIQRIFAKDHLLIKALDNILLSLDNLKIEIKNSIAVIMIYGAPKYIEQRLTKHFIELKKSKQGNIQKVQLMFKSSMDAIIGLHAPILGIILFEKLLHKDDVAQISGRLLRLGALDSDVLFYIQAENIDS